MQLTLDFLSGSRAYCCVCSWAGLRYSRAM